jgi:hypothetical protein
MEGAASLRAEPPELMLKRCTALACAVGGCGV